MQHNYNFEFYNNKPSGGTMVGKLKLTADATEPNDAVDKAYVDAILPAFTDDDNDKVLGIVNGALAWIAKE